MLFGPFKPFRRGGLGLLQGLASFIRGVILKLFRQKRIILSKRSIEFSLEHRLFMVQESSRPFTMVKREDNIINLERVTVLKPNKEDFLIKTKEK